MADKIRGKQKNIRSRVLIILAIVIILIGAGLGWWAFKGEQIGASSGAELGSPPPIASIPGAGQPTREYVRAQQQENVQQAVKAEETGTAAVPTITRATLIRNGTEGSDQDCSPESLRKARAAGVKAEELRCRGCDASALRAAGYTAGELMNAGFSANELRAAGYTAAELREAGFTAAELARAGFSAQELLSAGFNPAELAQAGIGAQQLTNAGVTSAELKEAAIGTKPISLPKDCSVEELSKARLSGVSAAEIRKKGCDATALKAAGYSAKELKDAGFSAAELRKAGFTAAQLKDAGFTAGELRQAGYDASQLADAGFSARELREAGYSGEDLKNAGFDAEALKAAGFSEGELLRAGYTPEDIFPQPKPIVVTAPPVAPAVATTTTTTTQGLATLPAVERQNDAAAALEALQRRQAEQLSEAQRQEAIEQLEAAMASQTGELLGSWAPPPQQQYVEGPKEEKPAAAAITAQTAAGQAGAAAIAKGTTFKAGSVMFAALDTAIDSDEQSPILATIVEGPLKGSKLIGGFERRDKKVLLTFSRVNIPGLMNSVEINAVAIDPETARTALASSVDSHYLLRYGTLFGSAFMSGLSEAIMQSGSTEVVLPLGGAIVENPTTTTSEKALIAAGEVGRQYANVMRGNFTRAPTVKVEAGTGLGILLMADLTLPQPLPQGKR